MDLVPNDRIDPTTLQERVICEAGNSGLLAALEKSDLPQPLAANIKRDIFISSVVSRETIQQAAAYLSKDGTFDFLVSPVKKEGIGIMPWFFKNRLTYVPKVEELFKTKPKLAVYLCLMTSTFISAPFQRFDIVIATIEETEVPSFDGVGENLHLVPEAFVDLLKRDLKDSLQKHCKFLDEAALRKTFSYRFVRDYFGLYLACMIYMFAQGCSGDLYEIERYNPNDFFLPCSRCLYDENFEETLKSAAEENDSCIATKELLDLDDEAGSADEAYPKVVASSPCITRAMW